jgi:hypothetical protein
MALRIAISSSSGKEKPVWYNWQLVDFNRIWFVKMRVLSSMFLARLDNVPLEDFVLDFVNEEPIVRNQWNWCL